MPVSREVLYGATPAEQARRIVEAQVQPPPTGTLSAIPAGTTVRAVFLDADRRGVRRSRRHDRLRRTRADRSNEALTVYAIVNAVTVNLPDVTAVQILIDGKEVDTLAGHLDLRAPLAEGARWVQERTVDAT